MAGAVGELLSEISEDDPLVRWCLLAFAEARDTAAPVLACLAGLQALPGAAGPLAVGFLDIAAGHRTVGDLEVAMLADFALGGALRAQVGLDRVLPTLSLSMELTEGLTEAAMVSAHSTDIACGPSIGTSAAIVRADAVAVGHASASFALGSTSRQRPLPWDGPPISVSHTPLQLAALGTDERAVLRTVLLARDSGEPGSWGDYLVGSASSGTLRPGGATVTHTPGAWGANRAGAVQGGVLFALGSVAARAVSVGAAGRLVSGQIRFLTTTAATAPIRAEASVQRLTRRTVFTEFRLVQADAVTAAGGIIYRRPAPDLAP